MNRARVCVYLSFFYACVDSSKGDESTAGVCHEELLSGNQSYEPDDI